MTADDQPNAEPAATEDHDSDAALMMRFRAGERQAFDLLFAKYRGPVINFAWRITGHLDRAEELAQEIFVKCYVAADSYEPRAKFSTWLFCIARNHCLNELRKREYRTQSQALDETRLTAGQTPEQLLAQRQLAQTVDQLLGALPESQRTALVLARFHEMSYEEIAQTMSTSVSAIKSLLNRARKQLMTELSERVRSR
ncbi:MAG: sigma-70 family RNA polymerase sigma factor [Deltaproteobacteria bacterium]|nr:sigma-70 family RNA polymerase sigma factor [Deltaproteobacteria bacterium]